MLQIRERQKAQRASRTGTGGESPVSEGTKKQESAYGGCPMLEGRILLAELFGYEPDSEPKVSKFAFLEAVWREQPIGSNTKGGAPTKTKKHHIALWLAFGENQQTPLHFVGS